MTKFLKLFIGIAVLGLAMVAHAGWDTGTFTLPTALSNPQTNSVTTNATASSYTITPGVPVEVMVAAHCTNTVVSERGSITNGFDVYNGTRWTTTQPLQAITQLNGVNQAVSSTTFTAAQLAGIQAIRPGSTATTTSAVTNVIDEISYSSFH
jgi:hypothetical protein